MRILSFITYRLLALISIFYTMGLSFFSPHLEIRFLLPALPLLHLLCGPVLQDMIQYGWSTDTAQNWYVYIVLSWFFCAVSMGRTVACLWCQLWFKMSYFTQLFTCVHSSTSTRKQHWCRVGILLVFVGQIIGVLYLISFHQVQTYNAYALQFCIVIFCVCFMQLFLYAVPVPWC